MPFYRRKRRSTAYYSRRPIRSVVRRFRKRVQNVVQHTQPMQYRIGSDPPIYKERKTFRTTVRISPGAGQTNVSYKQIAEQEASGYHSDATPRWSYMKVLNIRAYGKENESQLIMNARWAENGIEHVTRFIDFGDKNHRPVVGIHMPALIAAIPTDSNAFTVDILADTCELIDYYVEFS